jgi:hypothetical protein
MAAECAQQLNDEGSGAEGQTTRQREMKVGGIGPSQSGRLRYRTDFAFR